MDREAIVAQLDDEIRELSRVRKLLAGSPTKVRRGRNGHTMSKAARRKISLAQKARWREQRKAA